MKTKLSIIMGCLLAVLYAASPVFASSKVWTNNPAAGQTSSNILGSAGSMSWAPTGQPGSSDIGWVTNNLAANTTNILYRDSNYGTGGLIFSNSNTAAAGTAINKFLVNAGSFSVGSMTVGYNGVVEVGGTGSLTVRNSLAFGSGGTLILNGQAGGTAGFLNLGDTNFVIHGTLVSNKGTINWTSDTNRIMRVADGGQLVANLGTTYVNSGVSFDSNATFSVNLDSTSGQNAMLALGSNLTLNASSVLNLSGGVAGNVYTVATALAVSGAFGTVTPNCIVNYDSTDITLQLVPNSGPVVSISAPTNNASFTPGSSIAITANASEAGGTITNVAFYANATLLGNATSAPYSLTWPSVPAGSYALTAVASDSLGLSATSSVVTITVAAPPPIVVSITSPANNASFTPGSNIVITASASESGGTITNVAFYANATLLGNATSAPYSLTWPGVPVGSYALTAVASDSLGVSATSSVVNVTVATLKVYDDASAYGSSWISGANFGYGFQPWVLLGGGQYNGFIIQSSGNIDTSGESWGLYANGTGAPYAIAYRGFNNALTTGQVFSVKFQNTSISSGDMGFCLRSDSNTNFVDTSIITNSGTRFAFYIVSGQSDYYIWNGNGAIDSGIALRTSGLSLQLYLLTADTYELVVKTADDSTTLASFPSAPLAGASGSAIQTFAGFNVGTAGYQNDYFNSLQISSPGSVVSITSPTNNANFAPGSNIVITANASELGGTITNVAFYANAALLGNATSAPYNLIWQAVPAGSYALTAMATDALGNSATSSVVNITVGPVVSITSPANNASFLPGSSIVITANASEDGGTITNVAFYADATLLGNATSAPYSFTWPGVPAGSYALTAVATDATGASTTSSVVNVSVSVAFVPSQIKTVFVIPLENHDWQQACPTCSPQQLLGNPAAPYVNSLTTSGNSNAVQVSYAAKYYSVSRGAHPSEGNYVWSEAGTEFGVHTDNDPSTSSGNLFSTPNHLSRQLTDAGILWKCYQEDVEYSSGATHSAAGTRPSGTNIYNGSQQYDYAVKHNPMQFFTDTQNQNVYPLAQFWTDLTNNAIGRYNWITPDQYNEMHSYLPSFTYHGVQYSGNQAAIAEGDNFLSIAIPQIMASAAYQDHGVIIIWTDETESTDDTNTTLPFIVISPLARGNAYASSVVMSHSSTLKMMDEIFGLTFQTNAIVAASIDAQGTGYNYVDGRSAPVNDLSDLFRECAPLLVSQPASSTNNAGTNVCFSVAATACDQLSYQWYFGTNILAAETNSVLCLASVGPANVGNYQVVVTSGGVAMNSTPATLTVIYQTPNIVGGQMMLSSGGFQLTFSGPSGQTYQVLTSDDMTVPQSEWTVIGSGTFANTNVVFTDPDATNHAHRFYIIKSP